MPQTSDAFRDEVREFLAQSLTPDILEGARAEPGEVRGRGKARKVAEEAEDYAALSPSQLAGRIKALEQKMYQHARDLEFEDAARVRDQLRRLKDATLA